MKLTIRTDRLTLRTLDEAAADDVLAFEERNREHLKPWEPWRDPEYYTYRHQRLLLEDDCKQMNEGRLLRLWICKDDRIIGSAALSNIVRGAFQSCHLGYKIDAEEAGRGYMTEAVRALVEIGFETMKLHRIEANIMPRNAASLRVVEKLGFQPEGLARKYLKINGVWEDHIHMVLLNERFE
ncbi:GNAT family N-acetyltransferase [Paenibacillus sp.]|uniref:GNAT family N-acetyltransferase n=1 Tax=Paenibacillus sp. TaxID=58172 RepID=UPI002D3D805A|nr:GNAT family N-acetyltransferase [Paenibacillus sp.]HZG86743.1 GNAT family N-acetyltransferase [Paenibacillus sp.]